MPCTLYNVAHVHSPTALTQQAIPGCEGIHHQFVRNYQYPVLRLTRKEREEGERKGKMREEEEAHDRVYFIDDKHKYLYIFLCSQSKPTVWELGYFHLSVLMCVSEWRIMYIRACTCVWWGGGGVQGARWTAAPLG